MVPAAFDEENCMFDTPVGLTSEQCEPMSAWRGILENGIPAIVTCWKVTADELEEIRRTGRVWLMVMGRDLQPTILNAVSPWRQT